MTEQQWEFYRLSVVEEWPESPHKAAVIGAIKHKLMILALQEKASIDLQDSPASTPQPHKVMPPVRPAGRRSRLVPPPTAPMALFSSAIGRDI